MAFLTAERIISTALGLLSRESSLPRTVWRDPVGDFAGAKDDTISVRLPAYAPARTRVLRSGSARTKDTLNERKIDLTLDVDIYKDVGITDEQMNLDIRDFGVQVLNPIAQGVVEEITSQLAAEMSGATYARTIAYTYSSGDPWEDIVLAAREYLNKAHVPANERYLAVGAGVETAMLSHDLFIKANESGDGGTALADAIIGRKAGFTIVSAPELAPNEAYAYHKTAFALSNKAPAVPTGQFGAMQSRDGFAMRMVRGFDLDTVEHRTIFDSWLGTAAVTDEGYFDGNGVWTPATLEVGSAVTITTSAHADDIFDTTAAHGFQAGDPVVFTSLTGGDATTAALIGRVVYVIATSLGAQTFRVSLTPGGSAFAWGTADITAGTVRKGGAAQMVRAVKITAS
jgi:hypothetical protein